MQPAAVSSMGSAASESIMQSQIAAMRESLRNHRTRARELWNACAPESEGNAGDARTALGQFTERFLKRESDAVCG